jgi:hypothetical protein
MSVVEELRKRTKTLVYQRPLLREAYTAIQGVVEQGPILRRVRDIVDRVRQRIRG